MRDDSTLPKNVLFPDLFESRSAGSTGAASDGGAPRRQRSTAWSRPIAVCSTGAGQDPTRSRIASALWHRRGHPDDGDHLARTRSTSCCSTETRFRASGRRSRRCRGSRTQSTARALAWPTSWPNGSCADRRRRTGGAGITSMDPTTTRVWGAAARCSTATTTTGRYLPLLGFGGSFDRESESDVRGETCCGTAKAVASEGTAGCPVAVLPRLQADPRARILVRRDGGFASPAIFALLDPSRGSRRRDGRRTPVRYAGKDAGAPAAGRHVAQRPRARRLRIRTGPVRPRSSCSATETAGGLAISASDPGRRAYEGVYCARWRSPAVGGALRPTARRSRILVSGHVLMQEFNCAHATACARAQVPWLRDRLLEARGHGIGRRIAFCHTPKHRPELAEHRGERTELDDAPDAVRRRRIGDVGTLPTARTTGEVSAWSTDVNGTQRGVLADAVDDPRCKLIVRLSEDYRSDGRHE